MGWSFFISALARACILLAFSEYIFFNEAPGLALAQATTVAAAALHLGEMLLYYMLAGSLLYVLEPLATSWHRALLVGAFVGWSIEAAMVPVAYENVPFSYFWTAVSWHAVVDVCLGVFVFRAALSGPVWRLILLLVALGPAWAVWTTWAWDEAKLTPTEFAQLAAAVTLLLILGMALLRPGPVPQVPRWGAALVIGVNLSFWALWASMALVAAFGLALLAAGTGWALWRGAQGPSQIAPKGHVAPWRHALLAALCLWASLCYALVEAADWRPEPSLMTGSVAVFGVMWFCLALAKQIFAQRTDMPLG
jgi:hypothetical protein